MDETEIEMEFKPAPGGMEERSRGREAECSGFCFLFFFFFLLWWFMGGRSSGRPTML